LSNFNYPAFTIEAQVNKPVRVRWVNQLYKTVELAGGGTKKAYLPHLLPVDPTLHWANPPGPIDSRPSFEATPGTYLGPVPAVVHVHGAHATDESDGYAEAWFLPAADDLPAGYSKHGGWYQRFKHKFEGMHGTGPNAAWSDDSAVFQYPNNQRAATIWYHDHTLGMTRLNVYAGPAGFYLLRGGADGDPLTGALPSDAFEFPVAIQDRSFNLDAANHQAPLFYPDSRQFFDGFRGPYIPSSDVSPIWNPEVFGNTLVVNGNTWPKCTVERRRYRIRFLNGCNARTLILKLVASAAPGLPRPLEPHPDVKFWVIGTEGGFLPDSALSLDELLMMPAERFDLIIDFSKAPNDVDSLYLVNEGPDEPFGGGEPAVDFDVANPATTGVVMRFDLVPASGLDGSADPAVPGALVLPPAPALPATPDRVRQVSLNEDDSSVLKDVGPTEARLGEVDFGGPMPMGMPMDWMMPVTQTVVVGDTEVWEIYNFTMDAHPIHVHEVMFQVLDREVFDPMLPGYGAVRPREAWEAGYKDTVVCYPGEITRIKARFDLAGRYVWHCHIVEHEDNEMMRPYDVVHRQYMPLMGKNIAP
ncbi:MAG TPA: multicopper oxidase domain-containing protein, partial [Anaerolinea sp.]|nr:multicopper oxidase domain-containing protein [Anaerolinea sp.]